MVQLSAIVIINVFVIVVVVVVMTCYIDVFLLICSNVSDMSKVCVEPNRPLPKVCVEPNRPLVTQINKTQQA